MSFLKSLKVILRITQPLKSCTIKEYKKIEIDVLFGYDEYDVTSATTDEK